MRFNNVADLVGNTPIVRLQRLEQDCPGVRLYLKLEYQNPGGSVKDRPALQMIRDAEASGKLTKEKIIVDATSGNTGIAYSMMGAALGYRVQLVMPASVSPARKNITQAFGTELIFTPAEKGIDGSILHVQEMTQRAPDKYFFPDQYRNPSNPRAHYLGTGVEILAQLGNQLTDFVTGIGTTGTIMGTTRRLREHHRPIRCCGAEPATAEHGLAGLKHMASSIVPSIYAPSELDAVLPIGTEEGLRMVGRLAQQEGLYVGPSAGANVAAALQIARERSTRGQQGAVVTIACDRSDRYFPPFVGRSTILNKSQFGEVSGWQSDDGKEVRIFHRGKEYIFDEDEPRLLPMARELLRRDSFVAEDCLVWMEAETAWSEVQEILQQLVDADVLEAVGRRSAEPLKTA